MARIEWTDDSGSLMSIRFDSVQVVNHTQTSEVTRHPVEEGADIADHVRVDLPAITITGYVSQAPLYALSKTVDASASADRIASGTYQNIALPDPPAQKSGLASALEGGVLEAGTSALSSAFSTPLITSALVTNDAKKRVEETTAALAKLQESATLCTVYDKARTYNDMVITSVGVTRSVQDGTGATFEIGCEQIKQVTAKLGPIPAELRGMANQAAGAIAAAAGLNKTVDEKKQSEASSTAYNILQGAGLLP